MLSDVSEDDTLAMGRKKLEPRGYVICSCVYILSGPFSRSKLIRASLHSPPKVCPSDSSSRLLSAIGSPDPPPPAQHGLGEATSPPIPWVDTTGLGELAVMVEVEASAPQGQGYKITEVDKEGLGQSLAQPKSTPAPPPQPENHVPSTTVLGSEVPPRLPSKGGLAWGGLKK